MMVECFKTKVLRSLLMTLMTFLVCLPFLGFAQSFNLPEGEKFEKVKFQLINNLVIIPLEVNGTQLSFVLDSGVSTPILFNLSDQDSILINNVSEVTIKGLGDGEPIQALSSRNNNFKIGKIENPSQKLYVLLDKSLNFSPSLGIPVHGIIGYDLFKDFVVEMNYRSKKVNFHAPDLFKYKKKRNSETLPLSIIKKKSYIEAEVLVAESENVTVKMLLDTGSSDAIWLFENEEIDIPDKHYDDFLGRGLGGDVFGKRTKVSSMKIGSFILKDAKVAFPEASSFRGIKNLGDRNGSLGGEILKRFNIIFDYQNQQITLSKNASFKEPFHYNLSGIDLQHAGVRYVAESIANVNGLVKNTAKSFGNVQILMENRTRLSLVPEIIVSGIRSGSPAAEAGLKKGDVILAVNGKNVHEYELQEILQMLNEGGEGKRVRVLIERYNSDITFTFVLKDVFK